MAERWDYQTFTFPWTPPPEFCRIDCLQRAETLKKKRKKFRSETCVNHSKPGQKSKAVWELGSSRPGGASLTAKVQLQVVSPLVPKCLAPSLIRSNQSPLGPRPLPPPPHHLWPREPPRATGSLWATHTVHHMFRPWWWAAVLHLICWSLQMTSFLATSYFLWIISDLSKSVSPRSVTPPSSTTPSMTKGATMCQGLPVSPFFFSVCKISTHILWDISKPWTI